LWISKKHNYIIIEAYMYITKITCFHWHWN